MTAGTGVCREARPGAGQTAAGGGGPEEETGGGQAGERGIQEAAGAADLMTSRHVPALWGTSRGLLVF